MDALCVWCRRPMPIREQVAYGSRCEDCFASHNNFLCEPPLSATMGKPIPERTDKDRERDHRAYVKRACRESRK